jgi:hypothetical protein
MSETFRIQQRAGRAHDSSGWTVTIIDRRLMLNTHGPKALAALRNAALEEAFTMSPISRTKGLAPCSLADEQQT